MNTPSSSSPSAASSSVLSAAKCALLYLVVTNGSTADRWYAVIDAASLPSLTTASKPLGIYSERVAASGTWRPMPVDSKHVHAFDRGAVLVSFASKADGSPDYSQVSSADMSAVAWTAALQ